MYSIDWKETDNDWHELMEECKVYIALVTENFFDDVYCIEQTLYAKERNMPTILLWLEGIETTIPDLFKGMDIRAKIIFNEKTKYEMKDKLIETVKSIELELSEKECDKKE